MPGRRATREQRKRREEATDWIFRNKEPGQSEVEKAAFQQWLNSDPDNRRVYAAAERLMGEARIAIQSDPALRDFEAKPRNVTKPIVGALVAVSLATSLFFLLDGPMRMQADAMSGPGEMPLITLADGSTMQLNASSAVAYDYNDRRRTVRLLRGQVFFQVARDPERPFTVEAGDTRVTAVGTAFDVRLGKVETDVTVTHNAVIVECVDCLHSSVRVEEGQQAAYGRTSGFREVRVTDSLIALAWRRGQLVVDNAAFSDVIEEMRRHFSGRIVVASNQLSQRRVSGTLAIADTSAALAFLEHALGVRTYRIGPLIVIRN